MFNVGLIAASVPAVILGPELFLNPSLASNNTNWSFSGGWARRTTSGKTGIGATAGTSTGGASGTTTEAFSPNDRVRFAYEVVSAINPSNAAIVLSDNFTGGSVFLPLTVGAHVVDLTYRHFVPTNFFFVAASPFPVNFHFASMSLRRIL